MDYAGPVYVKRGHVRKPTVVKAYICVFVSLSVKAVHLELVSDLTTEAFIATLRRFIACQGKPSLVWSDHGSHFVGAQKELRELANFLEDQKTQNTVSQFTKNRLEVHPGAITTLWWPMGVVCKENEVSPQTCRFRS